MEESKNTYYISVGRGEINRSGKYSPYEFVVNATDEEITKLRYLFDQNQDLGFGGAIRAQTPYVQYHDDEPNQEQDSTLVKIYSLIHDIGDEEAVKHIESMAILPPTKEHPFIQVKGDHENKEEDPLQ
ncbi:hydrolase [Jeotgalibacillus proteolyticus]|uniref:Hydrolase n=1 Tax=Jeotgalibacillus proteolyticus TaxID=2082395 RepID=A0A2S5GFP8_9BACL|nr:hydrolase [Jeotgalibacillus proteolyticus]PPA71745.1 hydrolase [Jeotgalibacillus proteolyticus]